MPTEDEMRAAVAILRDAAPFPMTRWVVYKDDHTTTVCLVMRAVPPAKLAEFEAWWARHRDAEERE